MVRERLVGDAILRPTVMTLLMRVTFVAAASLTSGLAGLLAGAMRGESAAMPSLSLGTLAPVPVVSVIAMVPVIGAFGGWSNIGWHAIANATRAPRLLAAPVLVGSLGAYSLGSAVFGGVASTMENGRNSLGLLGLVLIGARVLGERGAVLLPVSFLFASFLFGRVPGHPSPSWWAWVLADGASAWALGMATLLGALGLLVAPQIAVSNLRRGAE